VARRIVIGKRIAVAIAIQDNPVWVAKKNHNYRAQPNPA
jgi:hypothetical protein